MIHRAVEVDPSPLKFLLWSLAFHLLLAAFFSFAGFLTPRLKEATPYYVDIVSLPTLEAPAPPREPQSVQAPVSPPAARATPAKPEMTVPDKSSKSRAQIQPADNRDQEAREFAERMNRIEQGSDARHQAAALSALQKKAGDRKAAQGAGDKGVDYGAYIQSRLQDALASTIVYRTKSPEMSVRIFIDKNGKLQRYLVEKPSNDKLFNDSVIRTIEKAKANFPPTPNGAVFEKLYVFSPKEVLK